MAAVERWGAWGTFPVIDLVLQFGLSAAYLCSLAHGDPYFFSKLPHKYYPLYKKNFHYHTAFGPIFHGPWVVYENTRGNLDRGLTRICGARDKEKERRKAQKLFFHSKPRGKNRVLYAIFEKARLFLAEKLKSLGHVFSEQIKYALVPHAKRKIRVQAIKEIIDGGSDHTLFTKFVRGKIKLLERAKTGKYPRLIGDFTTPGSLLGGFLCELAKKSFQTFVCDEFTTSFISSTDVESMDELGRLFFTSPGDYHVHFSDDSILKLSGRYYNLDISSCDKSNLSPVFDAVSFLFEEFPQFHHVIKKNIDQCRLPFKIKDPGRTASFTVEPAYPIEFSGTTLTTLLNVVASFSIGVAIHTTRAVTPEEVIRAAALAGYDVTLQECTRIEQVQFLKHSWYLGEDGIYHSFLNLGAILRGFGSCVGDLPGRGPIQCRAYDWNSAVLRGYCHSGESTLLRIMRSRFRSTKEVPLPLDVVKHFSDGDRPPVPDWAILNRYTMKSHEWSELCDFVLDDHKYSWIRSTAVDKIFKVDYDLDREANPISSGSYPQVYDETLVSWA